MFVDEALMTKIREKFFANYEKIGDCSEIFL